MADIEYIIPGGGIVQDTEEDSEVIIPGLGIYNEKVEALNLEQEGFRFRDDNGSEAAATWLALQDIDITRAKETNTRLRIIVNATGNPDSKQFKIQYKKTSDAVWRDMPES